MTDSLWYLLSFIILLTVKVSNAVDSDCDFDQEIEQGETYYISNPNYPHKYNASRSCRYHATSDTRIRITCNEVNIPDSPHCASDTFNVFTNMNSAPQKFCGVTSFIRESDGNEMTVTLNSAANSTGGIIRCKLEAIDPCRCGWKKPTKIAKGIETGINEYPMIAAVIDIFVYHVYCGGTIISNRYILTAAHCLSDLTVENMGILVGDHDITIGSETNATKLYSVSSYDVHPNYISPKTGYDVAVITIAGTITFSNEVGPACLPFEHSLDSFSGSYVDVLGWGTTEYAGSISNTLQKVKLSVINYSTCKKVHTTIEHRQICTFTEGKDSCQADSGGPVLWQNPTTRRLVLVGLISYGRSCAGKEPGVNTRVGSFVDWIVQKTPGAQYCEAE